MKQSSTEMLAHSRLWIVVCFVAGILIATAGFVYFRWEANRIQKEKRDEIAGIAKLKVDQIVRWREERKWDAQRLAESTTFRDLLTRWRRNIGDETLREALHERLTLDREPDANSVARLVDPEGRVLLSSPDQPETISEATMRAVRASLTSPGPVIGDLYRPAAGGPHLDIAARMLDGAGKPLAALVLTNDATEFLYPLIQSWPTPSRTAETLLVQRDGDSVLYLNELRHRRNTALSFRQPVAKLDLPAAQAILGREGGFVGADYRGVPVLANLQPIPGSTWFMVAKVDTSETLSELRYRAVVVLVVVIALVLFVTGMTAYIYRTRQAAERARVIEALKESEAVLAHAQRIARLGSWEWDLVTNRMRWSAETSRILGLETGNSHGPREKFLESIHPEDRAQVEQALTEALSGAREYNLDYRVQLADGTERMTHAQGEVVRDGAATPVLIRGTLHDITERKLLEDALRRQNEESARLNYTVSHDLRSPLVTIKAFLGYLEQDIREANTPQVETDLGYMHKAADRMSLLLDELLQLSRVGRKANPPEDVPLQVVVREALDLVAGRIAERKAEVQVTGAPVVLRGDRSRLVEVFQNLLDNAVKFMGEQPVPRVEVGAEKTGKETVLFVRDNGSGIDPRHKSRLFGLFEKLQPDTEGAGMGLALVKKIIEVHGGRIWVESDGEGHGATFKFTLTGSRGL